MTPRALRVLAVDDERSQLEDLVRLLASSPAVQEVDGASDGQEALVRAAAQGYDAIFLDVRMPGLDGVELGRVLRRFARQPALVFVSAYDSPAVKAFELRALDYLVKPVSRKRLEEALERVATTVEDGSIAEAGHAAPALGDRAGEDDVVAVASPRGGAIRLLPRSSILYVQSHGDFVRVVSAQGRYLLRETLSEIERRWQPFGFVRVHRQYLANLRQAVEVRPQLGGTAQLAFADGQTIPVARRQVPELERRLGV